MFNLAVNQSYTKFGIKSDLGKLLSSSFGSEDIKRTSNALICLLAFITFGFGVLVRKVICNSKRSSRLPPGPWRWPLLGTIPQLLLRGTAIHETLRTMAEKYGPIYTVWIGSSIPMVVVAGEVPTHEALIVQSATFASRPKFLSWKKISSGYRTTMTSDFGPQWQKMRKIVSKDLLSPSKLASYKPVRDSEIERLLSRLRTEAKASNGTVKPIDNLRISAVDIIMRVGFGDEFESVQGQAGQSENVVELDRCFRQIMDFGSIAQIILDTLPIVRAVFPFSNSYYAKLDEIANRTEALVLPVIESRRRLHQSGNKPGDGASCFVDTLISLQGKESLTDTEIIWNMVELMVAGTDNTSHILEWVLANVVTYPKIQQIAYEEILQAVGTDSGRRVVSEGDLEKLPYMQAVIKESMRRHMMTVLGIPKVTSQDCQLHGYDIPAQTMVLFHAGALAKDPHLWDDPLEFRPERFLIPEKNITESHRLAFIPFGAGRRSCPGANMGLLHLNLLLANLLFTFEWGPEKPGHAIDFTEKFRMVVIMKNPLRASIRERTPISS